MHKGFHEEKLSCQKKMLPPVSGFFMYNNEGFGGPDFVSIYWYLQLEYFQA